MTNMTSMHFNSVVLIGSNSSLDVATIMVQNSELVIEKSTLKNIAGCAILTARESRLVISDSLFLAKVDQLSRPLYKKHTRIEVPIFNTFMYRLELRFAKFSKSHKIESSEVSLLFLAKTTHCKLQLDLNAYILVYAFKFM